MKDRIPTPGQEGRVQIEYEDGTKLIVKISMADNPTEQGTPFATATMLTDETAALFGLDGSAVPNDAFRALDKRAKIQIGSYVGTGVAGADNPNVLTFEFEPKMLFVSLTSGIMFKFNDPGEPGYMTLVRGVTRAIVERGNRNSSDAHLNIAWNGNTVEWYQDPDNGSSQHYYDPDPIEQFNEAGTTYLYFAIG